MRPADFYDLSFEEWYAAVDGYLESLGRTVTRYPSASDFEGWDPARFEPRGSVRANGGGR